MKLNTFYKQGAALALCLTLSFPVFAEKDLVQYVNTLQGTNSTYELSWGNTYPTTAVPYPMNSWSPQTGKNGDGWKYQYSATTIRGFQPTHQCSPWVGDYGVFSLMPVSELVVDESKRATPFSHDKEIAKPHYYKVTLENGITTEFSPTTRSAHFRFSFPAKGDAFLVLDGYTKTSQVQIDVANHRITGYVHNGAFSPKTHKNYFIIQFDKPFVSYGTWENRKNTIQKNNLSREGEGIGAYVQFAKGSKVQAKVSTSYISPEQAEVTMTRELGKHSSVEVTKQAAADVWNQLLNRVLVEGGTEEDMKTFYSCMFRANLFSHKFYEEKEDGSPYYYSPYDEKIHDGYMFTDNGFWDTFRSQFPLTNILHPTMQGQYMQALLDAQEQCGWLPSWSFPSETGGMVGNHSISLLTDAWVKGIRTFDPEKALKAYAHEAMNKGPWGGPYCEGNAWHYNWSVFHDVQGLIDLTGGDERFVAKIDSVFALPGIVKYGTYGTKIHEMLEMELAKMGQYAQGNQPIQHMIYLYSYAGQPWKTQYWIRQVMDRLYNSSENGYPGDEDQGGMSSWYVLSALGIYSVCPGTDEYVLGSPKFRKATITMEDGKKFVIEAKGNSKDNVYIQNATLNGKRHTRNYIHYSDIVNGGVLELQMGNQPEKTRGTAKEDRPFSLSK